MRRSTDQEGQKLEHIARRGGTSSVWYLRATMLLTSAGGNRVLVIAKLMQADEDTVRDVIHRFNEIGLACLDLPLLHQPQHCCAGVGIGATLQVVATAHHSAPDGANRTLQEGCCVR